jgi:membrane protein involved in colicin uptake
MRQITTLAAIAGMLGCALIHNESALAGDVYKYVDERGTTLYTDKPIPGAVLVSTGTQRPAEVVQRNQVAAQNAMTTQLNASNQRIAENQSNQRAAESVAKDLEATRLERCKKARAQYETSINSQRLYREKDGGEREFLNDAELAQARVDARKQMEAICGPQG